MRCHLVRGAIAVSTALFLTAGLAGAQTTPGPNYPVAPVALPDSEEIALAASAAPAAISARADVYTVRDGRAVRIRGGDNGCACLVARDQHRGSLYPICFDVAGSRTLLWRELMEVGMRSQGHSEDEVRRAVDAAYREGRLHRPERMAVAYMMSPRQVLFSEPGPEGRRVGAWFPHLMISAPGLSRESLGWSESDDSMPFSVDGEGGYPLFIVKVPTWSDGTPVGRPSR